MIPLFAQIRNDRQLQGGAGPKIAEASCTIQDVTSVSYKQRTSRRRAPLEHLPAHQLGFMFQTYVLRFLLVLRNVLGKLGLFAIWRASLVILQSVSGDHAPDSCSDFPSALAEFEPSQVFFASKAALTLGKRSTFFAGAPVLSHG
jgi:hypothetical protein